MINNEILSEKIKQLRKEKKLHSHVIDKIKILMKSVAPDYIPVSEIQGLAGGRNDLLLFEYSSKKILFEVFASASQVSRDLRILDNTKSDIKIAVLIDTEVDDKVLKQFLRENPENNYPFIFISEILQDTQSVSCILKLKEIITKKEEVRIIRILNKKMSFKAFMKRCKTEGIDIINDDDFIDGDITFKKIFITVVASKIYKITFNQNMVMNVVKWLSEDETFKFILMKIYCGFNTILFTDLSENMGIYSDIELLDWLRIFNGMEDPYILLSMNQIFSEINEKFLKDKSTVTPELKFVVGQAQIIEQDNGCSVLISLPSKTKEIQILRPMKTTDKLANEDKTKEKEYYSSIIKII